MEKRIEELKEFLDASHSTYHAVAQVEQMLQQAGYIRLAESAQWQLQPGGKYYILRSGSALLAFCLPEGAPKGVLISAAHCDRPGFQLKENGELAGEYTRLSVEKYGGMLMASWLDRPLSVAGRVMVDTPDGPQARLVDIQKDLLMIPNVAIHMNRKANEGYAWNPAVDLLPLVGGRDAKGKLEELLQEAAGGQILGRDLYLYVRQNASLWGVEEEYLSAQGLDDLACCWGCAQGFMQAQCKDTVNVLCIFDHEEVGSRSGQGADSRVLEILLQRICKAGNWEEGQLLSRAFLISADNAHARHPNHPELSDGNNAPVMNEGVVLKFNGNLRYTTNGYSAAIFRKVCEGADVPVQTYYNRADLPGGSTLGSLALCHIPVPAVDIGLPQLAMHSCYETVGVKDVGYLADAMQAFYSMPAPDEV